MSLPACFSKQISSAKSKSVNRVAIFHWMLFDCAFVIFVHPVKKEKEQKRWDNESLLKANLPVSHSSYKINASHEFLLHSHAKITLSSYEFTRIMKLRAFPPSDGNNLFRSSSSLNSFVFVYELHNIKMDKMNLPRFCGRNFFILPQLVRTFNLCRLWMDVTFVVRSTFVFCFIYIVRATYGVNQ